MSDSLMTLAMPSRRFAFPSLLTTAFLLIVAAPADAQYTEKDFPAGAGREIVTTVCGGCHDPRRVHQGYTPEGWHTVVRMMLNAGAPLPPDKVETLTAYLIKNFPEQPRPPAAKIAGPVKVNIHLWDVPTPGSRPHDPAVAPDGAIWWSGQTANTLGRLDPKTGATKEYPIKTPMSGPHGLVADRDGHIWFAANRAGYVGVLDPKTGDIKEYVMPDPNARDPHTIAIAPDGRVWFTLQNANMIGRIDPKTGEIKLVPSPTRKSKPYGLKFSSDGVPIFCEFGVNRIATVDPDSMTITEYQVGQPLTRPRRIALVGDDVYYTDYSRGALGRINLKTLAVKEWPSPSGPKSQPYGIASVNGIIWYDESRAKPNAIVRFDPRTETFQTFAIPGGGDIVRNMDVDAEGRPILSHSLANKIGRVEVLSDRAETRGEGAR
ncbi:MAG TPA: SMP-30/gluconolactonase/LRE family protein [Xanthobacteraceae bacterium]|jgi:virginiamycin B lyase|nr:SMP-30/gluconolactonase/LRE family protein [Xanthobacteraceae bacterium]